uniref:Uncharacterized protein n=1 Tax=Arundo donax TaxID=35708 RepID=A0A0A9FC53_ARUDO
MRPMGIRSAKVQESIDFRAHADAKALCLMYAVYVHVPGVLRVLDDLLAILAPFVAVVEHVDVAHRLEAEPRLPNLPPRLPSAASRLLHPHRAHP